MAVLKKPKPDPRDAEIAKLKARIAELETRLSQDARDYVAQLDRANRAEVTVRVLASELVRKTYSRGASKSVFSDDEIPF